MMDFLLNFFAMGGPWMYLILLFAILALPLPLVAGGLHGMGKRTPSFLWVAPLAAIASVGAMGTWHGQSLATRAVAMASKADQAEMMANGISISLYTTVFSTLVLIVLGSAMAFTVSIGHMFSVRGERGKWSFGAGIGSIALVGLGTLVTAIPTAMSLASGRHSPLIVAGLCVGMLAVLCAGLVGLRSGTGEAGRDRSAGARFTSWAALSLAAWAATSLPRFSDEIMVFKAVAYAAPSEKSEMLAHGMDVASGSGHAGLGALLGTLAMGLALLLPLAGTAARSPIKVVLNSLLVAGTLSLLLLSSFSHWQASNWMSELNSGDPGPEPNYETMYERMPVEEEADAPRAEGKSGKKQHKLKKAKGSKVAIQKRPSERHIAESTGLLADLKRSATPSVGTGDPIILGALDKSLIDRVIKEHLGKIRYCYHQELNKNPGLSGKLVVRFVIAKDGSVSTANTKVSTLKNPTVEKCVNARFMRMRFPAPKGGGIVIVSYPFEFKSQGG